MRADDRNGSTILTELLRFRARWLTDLTRVTDNYMRSRMFLEWMRYSVMTVAGVHSLAARSFACIFFRRP